MQNIFNRKIIFQRRKRINFNNDLYKKIEEQIYEELSDYFLIFEKSEKIKNILLLNAENNFLEKELKINLEKLKINYFNFAENDETNFEYFNNSKKNNLIIGINSFHNVNYLEKYIQCVKNNLEDGGIFCGNFFGLGNLFELRNIISKNDAEFSKNIYPRFNAVISPESIYGILQSSGLNNITIIPEKINYEFNFNNAFTDAMNFLKNINEKNYLSNMQKNIPNRKIFFENIPTKINLAFEIIKFYCLK